MKYLRQFLIIILISFTGELLRFFLPLPIPASIYGLLILLFALHFKVLKVSDIKEASAFLIEIMPVMFIPASAGLINIWPDIQDKLLPILFITIVSTVLVMGISARVTQAVIHRKRSS